MKYNYDPESDVLAVTLSKRKFDYAEEVGDFVVHFDRKNKPVYVEILNAYNFLTKATTVLPRNTKQEMLTHLQA